MDYDNATLSIDGWIQQQGYPKLSSSDAGPVLSDRYNVEFSKISSTPQIGASYPAQVSFKDYAYTMLLSSYQIEPNTNFTRAIVSLSYVPEAALNHKSKPLNKPVYTLDNSTISVPLSEHAKYKVCWDHYLFGMVSTANATPSVPAWWATATKVEDNKQTTQYIWGKELSSKPPDKEDKSIFWTVCKEPLKKSDSYVIPAPIVSATTYYTQANRAGQAAAKVGKISTPAQTYGVSGGAWLVMSAGVADDSGLYRVDLKYQWAPKWDTDIYSKG